MRTRTQDIVIRQATEDDYEAACMLYKTVDLHHVRMHPTIFQEVEGPARPREHFVEKLASPAKAVFVAEWSGEIRGLADVQEEGAPPHPMFSPARIARIDNLVVAEDFRRQGVARALLDAVSGWARARGLDTIQLSVYAKNASALAFYEDEGFTPLVVRLERSL